MDVSRRDFLKISAGVGAAAYALTQIDQSTLERALNAIKAVTAASKKIVWLQGQCCTGCTISAIQYNGYYNGTYYANLFEILEAVNTSIEFHPTIMKQAGCYISDDLVSYEAYDEGTYVDAMQHLKSVLENAGSGEVTLVVEGSIPYPMYGDMEAGFCEVGMKYQGGGKYEGMWELSDIIAHIMENYQDKLLAVVGYGTCSAFGGIPHGDPNPTGAKGVKHFLNDLEAGQVPGRDYQVNVTARVVNLPACPAHPDWLVLTYAAALNNVSGLVGSLDRWGRPTTFDYTGAGDMVNLFGRTLHDACDRKPAFDAGNIARNWNEAIDNPEKCLLKLGCRGIDTYADCSRRLWNKDPGGIYDGQANEGNWCAAAGAACNSCAHPKYPDNVLDSSFFAEAMHAGMEGAISGTMEPSSLACYTCHNTTMPRKNKQWR